MERGFLQFVWRNSWRAQLWVLAITVAVFPLLYASLEVPKIIVNDAIGGGDGPRSLFGFELDRRAYLLALCGVLLALFAAVNGLKWTLNVAMGRTGERMLRRMRFRLFEHVMRFPMARFRSARQGELVQSMMGEIEPIGMFIGEALATPVFQGGMLLVFAGFIFAQDPWLGLAATGLIPLQAWLIPKLQARVIRLNRERAQGARKVADFIGESVGAIAAIQTDGAARWRLAQLSAQLHRQGVIRLALFKRKYAIKSLNNVLNQLPPFFFYAVGGWQVIEGRLDLGALVAALSAQSQMAAPWKALLVYVQNWTDFAARYGFVVEGFVSGELMGQARLYGGAAPEPLEGPLRLEISDAGPGGGGLRVPPVEIAPGALVALLGGRDGARQALLRIAAGLDAPAAGAATLGGRATATAHLPDLGAAIGHLPAEPYVLDASIRDNLAAGLWRLPPPPPPGADWPAIAAETRLTGDPRADPPGDWADYAAAGFADAEAFDAAALALVEAAGLGAELRALALDSPVDPELAARIGDLAAQARAALAQGAEAALLDDLVEPWRRDALNRNATLIENLAFGAFAEGRADPDAMLARPELRAALRASGAEGALVEIGEAVAAEFRALVEAVGGDSPVFDSLRGYSRDAILAAAEMAGQAPAPWRAGARKRLMIALAARFTPARDQMDVLSPEREARLLALRGPVSAALAGAPGFAPFDGVALNPGLTLIENVLRGALRYERRGAARRLSGAVEAAFAAAGGADALLRLGLQARAGRDGGRLSPAARRRVGLLRALLKRPRLLAVEPELSADLVALARSAAPQAILLVAAEEVFPEPPPDVILRFEDGVASVARGDEG
ncbi:MAG: ABC transporter transmembrane domain-containing protein [Rubrimonas sp.]|uniref:ABC transporter transmembrane domain-containing protein n=1 Tax=Rubrimonas sp. TaxID=2036015 RepID=UPI002FDD5EEC